MPLRNPNTPETKEAEETKETKTVAALIGTPYPFLSISHSSNVICRLTIP
jgi:hypothetical protein